MNKKERALDARYHLPSGCPFLYIIFTLTQDLTRQPLSDHQRLKF